MFSNVLSVWMLSLLETNTPVSRCQTSQLYIILRIGYWGGKRPNPNPNPDSNINVNIDQSLTQPNIWNPNLQLAVWISSDAVGVENSMFMFPLDKQIAVLHR